MAACDDAALERASVASCDPCGQGELRALVPDTARPLPGAGEGPFLAGARTGGGVGVEGCGNVRVGAEKPSTFVGLLCDLARSELVDRTERAEFLNRSLTTVLSRFAFAISRGVSVGLIFRAAAFVWVGITSTDLFFRIASALVLAVEKWCVAG